MTLQPPRGSRGSKHAEGTDDWEGETDRAALSNLPMAVTQVEAAWSYLLTGEDGHL